MKIGVKLILAGTIIISIALIAVTVVAVKRASSGLEDLTNQQLISRSQGVAQNIEDIYAEEVKIALSFANSPAIVAAAAARDRGGDGEGAVTGKTRATAGKARTASAVSDAAATATACLAPFKDVRQLRKSYESVNLMDSSGVVFAAASPESLGVDAGAREYFKKAMRGQANIGDMVISKVSGKPVIPIAAPVIADGKVVGVFNLVLQSDFLTKIINSERVGHSGYAAVINSAGIVIAHPKQELVMKMNALETEGMKDFARDMVDGKTGISHYVFQGNRRTAGFAPVKSTEWSVTLTLPESEYLAASNEVRNLLIVISLIALVCAFVLFLLFSRSITVPLSKGVAFAQTVASGDFTHQLNVDQRDEIGVLAEALNGMSMKLSDMVVTIQESAEQVASSSEEITASAQKLAEGAQSQASTLEETSAAVEELSASVDQVAENAQSQAAAVEQGSSSMEQVHKSIEEVSKSLSEVAVLSAKSVESALEGAKAVGQVVEGINLIAGSSEKIGGIVNVISDIADQTNLLALNASIEAARAGEHGRGFAVVADEVSKLADRSSASTKQIEELIKESVRNVADGVKTAMGSQAAMEQIRLGAQQAKEVIEGLSTSMTQQVDAVKKLAKALENVSEMSQSISAATEQQTTNAKQVSRAVESVNEVTQGSASAAEEMSASTEHLSQMAQELQAMVTQFKIRDGSNRDAQKEAVTGGNGHGEVSKAHVVAFPTTVGVEREGGGL